MQAYGKCEHLDPHYRLYEKDTLLIDHIKNHLPNESLKRFINDRNYLQKVPVSIRLDTLIIINSVVDGLDIMVEIRKKTAKVKDLGKVAFGRVDQKRKYIKSIDGRKYYGISKPYKRATAISFLKISINSEDIILPKDSTGLLLFPNFCYEIQQIKPIELFYDPELKVFSLYIFGIDSMPRDLDTRKIDSYMAKFIFSEKGYIGSIIVDRSTLQLYQWNCKDFIGF